MRIRGEKPWALIDKKIVRFRTAADFDAWSDNDLRRRLDDAAKLGPDDYFTMEQVCESLSRHKQNLEVRKAVTRKPQEKRIKRRRLWPA
jgi:hypothetical protein